MQSVVLTKIDLPIIELRKIQYLASSVEMKYKSYRIISQDELENEK